MIMSNQFLYHGSPGKWWFNGGLMGFNQENCDFNGMYPLVNIQKMKKLLKMAIEIVSFPIPKMVEFSTALKNYPFGV